MQTFDMMKGAVDYNGIFLENIANRSYKNLVHYQSSTTVFYVVFVIIVGLLLTNLLVSTFWR